MRLFRSLEQLSPHDRGGAVSIGNFDGVHRGHARIIERLRAMAAEVGGPAVAFTFDPHPSRILRPKIAATPLCWTERKAALLAELGADVVIAYPTDAAFLRLSAEEFFETIVLGRLGARAVVEGPNFFFGRGRGGNVDLLRQLCSRAGVRLEVVEPVLCDGEVVSSSRVRQLISEGQLDRARGLLTRPYCIRGTVVRGAGRGASLGYPTANLAGIDTVLPAEGIYAGRALVDAASWPAAISLGPNPTFAEAALKVEAHLIGYQGLLYDRPLEVEFWSRLRDVQRFDSVERLLHEMARDVAAAQQIVS